MKYLKNQLLVTTINFIAILYVNYLWQGGVRLPINRFCSQVFADYQAIKSLDAKKYIRTRFTFTVLYTFDGGYATIGSIYCVLAVCLWQ